MTHTPLRVAINAQLYSPGTRGGVATTLAGLVRALGTLDGPEEYLIIEPWQEPGWLRVHLGPNQRTVTGPLPNGPRSNSLRTRLRSLSSRIGPRAARDARSTPRYRPPVSDGFYERLGCDVMHFPDVEFVVSSLPMVYNPHDLQHVHYPEFFTPKALGWRHAFQQVGCELAHTVVVESQWVKDDIVKQCGLDPQRIQVIPVAAPTQTCPEPTVDTVTRVLHAHGLDEPFALYPAITWPHKNHLALLDAVALLRDRDHLRVKLVCTGHQNGFWPQIEQRLDRSGLRDQVTFLGMVPAEDLRALYRLAQCVVIPTLFEAASEPVYEAWQDGAPVACSNVTSLPTQVRDAALMFDPHSVESIAAALREIVTDAHLREILKQRGTRRLRDFSWDRTAKAYRAVYRRAARRVLTEEDRWLLTWDWMQDAKAEQPSVPRAG